MNVGEFTPDLGDELGTSSLPNGEGSSGTLSPTAGLRRQVLPFAGSVCIPTQRTLQQLLKYRYEFYRRHMEQVKINFTLCRHCLYPHTENSPATPQIPVWILQEAYGAGKDKFYPLQTMRVPPERELSGISSNSGMNSTGGIWSR